MSQQPLTQRQEEFLAFLRRRIQRTGSSPSLRAAAAELGISHTAVASLLHALENKGWLVRTGRYSRTIQLLDCQDHEHGLAGRRIPIIGRVAAGLPLYAQEEWAGYLLVDDRVYRGSNLFALRVQGDSMEKVGILDQDLAICEPRQFAENGEIVVALIDQEEATVKRFFYHGDHIELRPENDRYQTMRYRLGEVLIQGRVIGIHRSPEQLAAL